MKKLNLAIIGQGRSGKDIHGKYFISQDNIYYDVKYVVDADEYRRKVSAERYEGCKVFSDYRELLDKKDIDLVVNASYSDMHFEITKDLLEHKFNVLVEKPFARSQYECDVLMQLAKQNNVVLAVFQQTFFAPFYQDVLRILQSGLLGNVYQINIRYNSFSRRWDWQTLQKRLGGNSYNTGPHPFGIALGILGFDQNTRVAFSKLATTNMSSGDSDDYCKVILDTVGKPVVDVEINNTDAFSGYNVKIQGDKGCYKCTPTSYEYKYYLQSENPKKPVEETFIFDENGNPKYCKEQMVIHQESGKFDGTAFDVGTAKLYENVYFAITQGKSLYVSCEHVRQIIAIIESIHATTHLEKKF